MILSLIIGFMIGVFATSFVAIVILCMPEKRKTETKKGGQDHDHSAGAD